MLSYRVQLILVAVVGVIMGLSALSRRFPHVAWLQAFRLPEPSPQQQAEIRRRSYALEAVRFLIAGLVVPFGYLVLTVMSFREVTPAGMGVSLAISALCIGLAVHAFRQSGA